MTGWTCETLIIHSVYIAKLQTVIHDCFLTKIFPDVPTIPIDTSIAKRRILLTRRTERQGAEGVSALRIYQKEGR